MEEEFDKWLAEDVRPLNDTEMMVAKLAFYRAYEVGFKDGEYASANYGWGN